MLYPHAENDKEVTLRASTEGVGMRSVVECGYRYGQSRAQRAELALYLHSLKEEYSS